MKCFRRTDPRAARRVSGATPPARGDTDGRQGTGLFARQKNIVQGRITNGSLFPNISVAISTAMSRLVKKTGRRLRADVTAALSHIETDFGIALEKQRESLVEARERTADEIETDKKVSRLAGEVEQLQQGYTRLLGTIAST